MACCALHRISRRKADRIHRRTSLPRLRTHRTHRGRGGRQEQVTPKCSRPIGTTSSPHVTPFRHGARSRPGLREARLPLVLSHRLTRSRMARPFNALAEERGGHLAPKIIKTRLDFILGLHPLPPTHSAATLAVTSREPRHPPRLAQNRSSRRSDLCLCLSN